MSQFNDITDVKVSIRAVLSSSQNELTVNDLSRDYKKFDGAEIPFKKFGYRSLAEFLRSIPDTVTLQDPYSWNSVVHPVIDGKTAHIDKLVTKQKPALAVNKRPKRSFHLAHPNETIPFDVKKNIWHLISPYREGMPLNLFHEKVNHLLYQSFITRSVEDVVDDISNFTYIADRRIFLKDSAKRNDNTIHMKKNEELQKTDSPRILMPSDSESESDNQFNLSFEDDLNYPSSYGKRKSTKTRGDAASEVNANEYCEFPEDNNPIVSKILIENLRLLLDDEENKNGIWACDLAKKFLIKFGYALCPKSNGFEDVIEMAAHLPEVFKYRRFRFEGDYLLEDARKKVLEEKKEEEGEIPIEVINDLKKLLSKRSKHCLYTDELPLEYKRFCQKTLKPKEYGFENMDYFLKHLEECSNEFTFRRVKEKVLIYLNDDPVNDITDSEKSKNDALLNVPRFNPFPNEVCQIDFKLDSEPFLDHVAKGQKFPVKIAEVYTPGKFYLHLSHNVKKLERMMEDLNSFYEENGGEYEVLATAINRGLLCACQYSADSRWHRVSVINTKLTKAKAKFIDYGTMEEVGVDKLRYLHRDFALYPPLAIRSKLAGIQPKKNDEQGLGNRYENSTCHIFYDISSSGDLEAEVVEYNVKAACLEVYLNLIKETGERQPIHDELIRLNLVDKKNSRSPIEPIQLDLKVSEAELKSIPANKSKNRKGKMNMSGIIETSSADAHTINPNIEVEEPPKGNTTRGPPPGLSLPPVTQLNVNNNQFFDQPINRNEAFYGAPFIIHPSMNTPSFSPVMPAPTRFNPFPVPRVMNSLPHTLNSFMPSYQRYPNYQSFEYNIMPNATYIPPRPPPANNIKPPPGLFYPPYGLATVFPSNVSPQMQAPPAASQPTYQCQTAQAPPVVPPLYQCQNTYCNERLLNNNADCFCMLCLRTTANEPYSEVKDEKKVDDVGRLASTLEDLIINQISADQSASRNNFAREPEENVSISESVRERIGVENELKKYFETELECSSRETSDKVLNTLNLSVDGLRNSSVMATVKRSNAPESRCSNVSVKSSDDPIGVRDSIPNSCCATLKINEYDTDFSNKTMFEYEESTSRNIREDDLAELLKVNKEKINPIKQFVLQCKKQAAA